MTEQRTLLDPTPNPRLLDAHDRRKMMRHTSPAHGGDFPALDHFFTGNEGSLSVSELFV